jgi:hypothetical protein
VGSYASDPDQGARYPEESRGYFELKGPFCPESETKPASFQVPASLTIKGVVLYNPDDTSPAGRFSAWLANALDKDNKTLGVNWLNLAVKRYGQTWITTGQVRDCSVWVCLGMNYIMFLWNSVARIRKVSKFV